MDRDYHEIGYPSFGKFHPGPAGVLEHSRILLPSTKDYRGKKSLLQVPLVCELYELDCIHIFRLKKLLPVIGSYTQERIDDVTITRFLHNINVHK